MRKTEGSKRIDNGISDEEIVAEIIREPSAIKEPNKVISEQVLCLTKRVE